MIKLTYEVCDGTRKSGKFQTIEGARRFAQKWLGVEPVVGDYSATSQDGVATMRWEGCDPALLWPKAFWGGCDDDA